MLRAAFSGAAGRPLESLGNDVLGPDIRERLLRNSDMSAPLGPRLPFGQTVRAAWSLIKPYWLSAEKGTAWMMLGIVGLACAVNNGVALLENWWIADFFNNIATKNAEAFTQSLYLLLPVGLGFALANNAKDFAKKALIQTWQRWMTENMVDEWMGRSGKGNAKPYFQIETGSSPLDNPDQRLTDNIKDFTTIAADLCIESVVTLLSLISFSNMLWQMSANQQIQLFGHTMPPGFLCMAALAYTGIGFAGTHLIGKKLSQIVERQFNYDGDFRYLLMRIRDHAVSIAAYNGEPREKGLLKSAFARAIANKWEMIKTSTMMNTFNTLHQKIGFAIPYKFASPLYFAGAVSFGALTKIADAFGRVQGNLNWFIAQYQTAAGLGAIVYRLDELKTEMERLSAVDGPKQPETGQPPRARGLSEAFSTKTVRIPEPPEPGPLPAGPDPAVQPSPVPKP